MNNNTNLTSIRNEKYHIQNCFTNRKKTKIPVNTYLTGNPSCSENGVAGQNSPRHQVSKTKNGISIETRPARLLMNWLIYIVNPSPVSKCSVGNTKKRFYGGPGGSLLLKMLMPRFHSSKKKDNNISQKAGLYQINREKLQFCRNRLIEAVFNRLLSCFRPEIFIFC
jgi:hypothetical protein